MKRHLVPYLLLASVVAAHGYPELTNGDFSRGLSGWTWAGDVGTVGEQAALGDSGVAQSLLFQPVALSGPEAAVAFDVWNLLSSDVAPGYAPDSFFASLYFIDHPETFDLESEVYDGAVGLFDMDAHGVYNRTGSIGASGKGADWFHFEARVSTTHAYAIPVFELYGLNGLGSDSAVLIDNVSAIPEPATFALMVVAGLCAVLMRRGRRGVTTRPGSASRCSRT